jgi:hypothetical protein
MPIRKIERNKSIRGSEDEDASPEGIPWKRMVTMVVARIIQSSHKKEERRPDQSGQERDSQIERERQRPETVRDRVRGGDVGLSVGVWGGRATIRENHQKSNVGWVF